MHHIFHMRKPDAKIKKCTVILIMLIDETNPFCIAPNVNYTCLLVAKFKSYGQNKTQCLRMTALTHI